MSNQEHWLPTWKPTQDVCLIFDDKTGAKRTPEQIDQMIDSMREVAGAYGFDLNIAGLRRNFMIMFGRQYVNELMEKIKP